VRTGAIGIAGGNFSLLAERLDVLLAFDNPNRPTRLNGTADFVRSIKARVNTAEARQPSAVTVGALPVEGLLAGTHCPDFPGNDGTALVLIDVRVNNAGLFRREQIPHLQSERLDDLFRFAAGMALDQRTPVVTFSKRKARVVVIVRRAARHSAVTRLTVVRLQSLKYAPYRRSAVSGKFLGRNPAVATTAVCCRLFDGTTQTI
jgi:hypothetical protein